MKSLSPVALVFSALLAFLPSAFAETQQAPTEVAADTQSVRKPFTISPTGTIELPRGTTTVLKAVITEPPRGLRASTSGVSLNGYIGYVPYQGRNLMVTVVDSVTRGEHTVTMPRRIEAQEYRDKTVLSQQDKIKLEVDPADLDAALDQLAEMGKEEPQAKDQADKEQKPQTASGASNTEGGGATGTDSTGNGLAGSYQNPAQADFKNAKTEIKTSIDGCTVRIDAAQKVAIQQSKTQTFEDGKLKTESKCTDSELRYALQKSHDGCSDIVDVNVLTAYRQSQTFYNRNGSRVAVSSCAKDTGATYTIAEDASGCAPVVDRVARKVKVYARLAYTGSTNAQVQVRGCAISKTQSAL